MPIVFDQLPHSLHHSILLPDSSSRRHKISDAGLAPSDTSPDHQQADLIIPQSRTKGSFHAPSLKSRAKSPIPWTTVEQDVVHPYDSLPPPHRDFPTGRPKNPASSLINEGTQTRKEVVNRSVDALAPDDKEEIRRLRDIVQRQNKSIVWYKTRCPDPGPSTLHDLLESDSPSSTPASAIPLLNAYDNRLATAERSISELGANIGRLESQKFDIERQRDDALRNAEMFRARLERDTGRECQKCAEYQQKIEELKMELQRREEKVKHHDTLASKAQMLQTQLVTVTNHLSGLQPFLKAQHRAIKTLTESATKYEDQLTRLAAQLEGSSKSNKSLLQRCTALGEEVIRLREVKREAAELGAWKRKWEAPIMEIEECMLVLNLPLFREDTIVPNGVLLPKLKQLVEDFETNKRAFNTLHKAHTVLLHQHKIEMDKKSTQLGSAQKSLQDMVVMAKESRHSRNKAMSQVHKTLKSAANVEDTLRRVLRRKEAEVEDVIRQMNTKIKALREEYDRDRLRAQLQIDSLTKSKIELQTEIGRLLRDKRSSHWDSMYHTFDPMDDGYRLDLGIAV